MENKERSAHVTNTTGCGVDITLERNLASDSKHVDLTIRNARYQHTSETVGSGGSVTTAARYRVVLVPRRYMSSLLPTSLVPAGGPLATLPGDGHPPTPL